MEVIQEIEYRNTDLTHDEMIEKHLGKNIEYYSVFHQFYEDGFQEMKRYYNEWFQVYTPENESEPLYNVYFIDFTDGTLMMLEYF